MRPLVKNRIENSTIYELLEDQERIFAVRSGGSAGHPLNPNSTPARTLNNLRAMRASEEDKKLLFCCLFCSPKEADCQSCKYFNNCQHIYHIYYEIYIRLSSLQAEVNYLNMR